MARFDKIDDRDADREHIFECLDQETTFTYVKLAIILAGEVKRLRMLGVRED